MVKKIILVHGWAYSGKDTFANYLAEKHGYKKLWFSYPLKNMTSIKYGIDRSVLDTHAGKESIYKNTGLTIRDILISEACAIRKQDDAFFANKMVEKIKKLDGDSNIVISDWRFLTEINTLKDKLKGYNIKTVHMHRFETPVIRDESEFALDNYNFDVVLANKSGLDKIYDFIDINIGYFF